MNKVNRRWGYYVLLHYRRKKFIWEEAGLQGLLNLVSEWVSLCHSLSWLLWIYLYGVQISSVLHKSLKFSLLEHREVYFFSKNSSLFSITTVSIYSPTNSVQNSLSLLLEQNILLKPVCQMLGPTEELQKVYDRCRSFFVWCKIIILFSHVACAIQVQFKILTRSTHYFSKHSLLGSGLMF